MKWYEQTYVNRRDWVLENLSLLGLSAEETVLVLMIDFLNEQRIPIAIDTLAKRSGMSDKDVDRVLSVLTAKKYLAIKASTKRVVFSLSGLFETDTAKTEAILDAPLFDLFETEFGRALSQKEMEKINEWNHRYDRKMITYALREASAYQKVSLPYIDKILNEWHDKNVTVKMIEEGKV